MSAIPEIDKAQKSIMRPQGTMALNLGSGHKNYLVIEGGLLMGLEDLAPRAGLEPATSRLTAGCSTN